MRWELCIDWSCGAGITQTSELTSVFFCGSILPPLPSFSVSDSYCVRVGAFGKATGWHSTVYNVGINVKYDIYEVKPVQPFFLCLLAIKAVLIIGPSIYSKHRVTQWCFAAVWLLKWPCVSCVGCRKAAGAEKLFLFLHLSLWLALVLLFSCAPSQEKDIWACWLQHLCCHTLQLPWRPWVH